MRLSNNDEEGRRQALLSITANMKANEAKNVGYRRVNGGKYEVYIKDAGKISLKNASAGYQYLVSLVGDHTRKVNFALISKDHAATNQSGERVTEKSLALDKEFGGGVCADYGDGNYDVYVQKHERGQGRGIIGLTKSGRETPVASPDYIMTAHELFGEAMNKNAVGVENVIRQFHGLPLRSGSDHQNMGSIEVH